MKILIVEDDPSLQEIMQRSLLQERYDISIATTYTNAKTLISAHSYDCILLDIMLPDGNGLLLLEWIKSMNRRDSIIIISARNSIDDKVVGLDQGADDYLPKPFHMAELKARIKSVIRRKRESDEVLVELGNLSIEQEHCRVKVEGVEMPLRKKEYEILLYFMQRPDYIIDKFVLAEAVWGDHIDQIDNFDFVYAQIKNLRNKLSETGSTVEIKAIYGFGYKLTLSEKK